MNDRMDQHFATHGDIERMPIAVIERMSQLEIRLIERMSALEVRLIERTAEREIGIAKRAAPPAVPVERPGKRMARWMIALFVAQSAVLIGTVLGMIEVLR